MDDTGNASGSRNCKRVKLALLLCDTPVPAVLSSKGTYLDIFREQLQSSYPNLNPDHNSSLEADAGARDENVTGASLPFTLDGFDVVDKQEYPDLDKEGYTGVLISGSRYSAYDNDPWTVKLVGWVRETAEKRPDVKLIGICFGHQIITRALGGECVPNNGRWEVGTTDMELTDVGKKVFGTDRPTLAIQQMHRDHVPAVPPSFYLLGSSSVAPVQGLVRFYPSTPSQPPVSPSVDPKDIQILTVQGHPEFTPFIVNAIIDVREKIGAMDPEIVREGRERAGKEHEGRGIIGRTIWRVLGVDGEAKA